MGRVLALLTSAGVLAACAAQGKQAPPLRLTAEEARQAKAQRSDDPARAAAAARREQSRGRGPSDQTKDVIGGVIPRATLQAVLDGGVARFLRAVHAEPQLERDRFVGWRIVALFPEAQGVQPDDVVVAVNGRSIERPEQFKRVWDGLPSRQAIVVRLLRRGQPVRVRYVVAE